MRTRAVAAALGLLALVGCSGGEKEPEALPALSPRPSASSVAPLPSPSLTGEKAAVEQAVLAYYAALNSAFASGDLTAYTALHAPTCQTCKRVAELVTSTTAQGRHFEGVQNVVTSYTIPDFLNRTAVADVRFRVTPYRIVAADGSVVDTSEGSQRRNVIVLNEVGGRWVVGEVNAQ